MHTTHIIQIMQIKQLSARKYLGHQVGIDGPVRGVGSLEVAEAFSFVVSSKG